MATDPEIIEAVRQVFAAEPRPEHFTNHTHCCECAEHDALLASRDLDSLRLADVNNAGWDPICFVTVAGFRYYLPALVRLAFESATTEDWYLPQLLFHLTYDGPQNRRVMCCSAAQQRAIAAMLWHVVETRAALIVRYGIEDDLQLALEIWSAPWDVDRRLHPSVRAFSRHRAALGADGVEVDQIRPFGKVSDEPEQSQYHEEDDEQEQALPRSGLWLRAIDPVKFHWRVPQPSQPLHQASHPHLPSTGAGLALRTTHSTRSGRSGSL